uniref:SCAN box domain-containing protein n=1 Tax=Oryzias sinensis TaxID=183150 RepID=A0A8C7XXT5_9TELE
MVSGVGSQRGPQKGEDAERRNISPGTCCRRLRSAKVPSGRRPAGACGQWKGLCRGWERPEQRTKERNRGVAVVERPVHPSNARTLVEEHEPEDCPADAWRLDCRASTLDKGRLQNCRVEIGVGLARRRAAVFGSLHIVDPSEEGDGVTVWHRQMTRGGHTMFYCLCIYVFYVLTLLPVSWSTRTT